MSKQNSPRDFDAVVQRLKTEAMEERPDFSAALHERLLSAIAARPRPAAAVRQHATSLRRWLVAVAAAACVAAWLSLSGRDVDVDRTPQKVVVQAETPSLEPVELAEMAGLPGKWSADLPALMAMSSQQWAHLDVDLQLALDALADHLPLDLEDEGLGIRD